MGKVPEEEAVISSSNTSGSFSGGGLITDQKLLVERTGTTCS